MEPVCKDCRHRTVLNECRALERRVQDIVTGRMEKEGKMSCSAMRSSLMIFGTGRCGPEGKLFEAKASLPQRVVNWLTQGAA